MTSPAQDDLIERLEAARGVGWCLAGDCSYIIKLCKEAAAELRSLRARVRQEPSKWKRLVQRAMPLLSQMAGGSSNSSELAHEVYREFTAALAEPTVADNKHEA